MERGRYYGVPRLPKPIGKPISSFDPIDKSLRYYCCDCCKIVPPVEHDAQHDGEHVLFPINEARLSNNAVDLQIVPLLRTLIVLGFGTLFSCYGHLERVGQTKPTYPYVVFKGPRAKVEPMRTAVQRLTGRALDVRPDGDAWRLCPTPEAERRLEVRDVQALIDQLVAGLAPIARRAEAR
ncbi:MAG: hypothetical protein JOZ39_11320 [Chloroflexi bacterium]|nr:hypothetical protein [Chloroflexota bacterium]